FSSDRFQKPYPFQADLAVSVDDVFEQKLDAIHELTSQAYEGGASGSAEYLRKQVPPEGNPIARREWLQNRWSQRQGGEADRFREALIRWYGEEQGKAIKYAEVFEICEYGRRP